jgi:CubicO group peptidase (beta-lactamase class C family)
MRYFAPLCLCFCLNASVFAQKTKLSKDQVSQIEALFAQQKQAGQPGLALGIVRNGQTLLAKGYGLANLEHQVPFQPQTVSDIGSVAKQITCFAVLLLAKDGALKLDDDIRKYLPNLPDFGQTIRIQDLMRHTSGLREIYAMLEFKGWRQGDLIRQAMAMELAQNSVGLNFLPGTAHSYCNTGYMLLAEIVQKVSNTPFETWMKKRVFEPLGMKHTYIMDQQGEWYPQGAASYQKTSDGTWKMVYDNSTVMGAGGIYCDLPDLVRWLDNLRTGQLGGQDLIRQMTTRSVFPSGDTLNYAFGLEVEKWTGNQRWQHTGSSAGFRAILTYFPAQQIGILIKANFAEANCAKLSEQIARILMPDSNTIFPDIPGIAPPLPPLPMKLPANALATYAGNYFLPEWQTWYQVEAKEDGLLLHGPHGKALSLIALGEDHFYAPPPFGNIWFKRDKQGYLHGFSASSVAVRDLFFAKKQ